MEERNYCRQQQLRVMVSDLISSLKPRQSASNSVARALEEAMSLIFESRTATERRKVVILAHDGVNTDLVAETLEAVSNVENLGATTFAALGVCSPPSTSAPSSTTTLRRRLHGVRGRRAEEDKHVFTPGQKCGFDKVDLTLVLDTSGSVFRVFEDQRQIALDMLDEIPTAAYADAVQVSVTRFAANADVMLPFLRGRSVDEIKDTVKEVKFTGQNTRIASAVEIALDEMERARRPDARQIFVLISDGHGQEYWNVVQATGKRLQAENESEEQNEDVAVDELSEVSAADRTVENSAARLRDIAQSSSTCDVDLLLIIDRSESVEEAYKKEIGLAIRSVELFPLKDFNTGRIRVGAVSFAKEARVELPLVQKQREEVVKALEEIRFTGGSTSSVTGAQLAIQQLVSSRRSSARLVFLLLTDGKSQDYWRELIETSMRIRDLPNSVLLAVTASHSFSERELQVWAGEKSKVFLSNEENSFLHALNKEVRHCGKEETLSKIGEVESVLKKDGQRNETLAEEQTSTVSSTTGSTSVEPTTVILNDGTVGEEELRTSTTAGVVVQITPSTSFAPPQDVLKATTDAVDSDLLVPITTEEVNDIESTTSFDAAFELTTDFLQDREEGEGSGFVNAADERRAQGIRTAEHLPKIEEEKGRVKADSARGDSSSCTTDLMFVIDTSTSVEAEFQQQLQFAVDLVKRLPTEDFEHRVRVGVVVFNSKSSTALRMGEPRSRSAVLDSLLSLHYFGGSTSVASGVNTAVDEIEKDRRKDARLDILIVILLQ
ncbi:von Willebrand factor type A domain protein [Oesophagostomum dentatum]|uniref:von Willebrand factor type A domain protein n=1 Tax=Oesophagostomum dentatum TaxID=61180 RepID=A0A0B1T167_OESDE|nr:von Willebrand factor type A domain protein [Oesophagostomum dentatum]